MHARSFTDASPYTATQHCEAKRINTKMIRCLYYEGIPLIKLLKSIGFLFKPCFAPLFHSCFASSSSPSSAATPGPFPLLLPPSSTAPPLLTIGGTETLAEGATKQSSPTPPQPYPFASTSIPSSIHPIHHPAQLFTSYFPPPLPPHPHTIRRLATFSNATNGEATDFDMPYFTGLSPQGAPTFPSNHHRSISHEEQKDIIGLFPQMKPTIGSVPNYP